MFMGFKPTVFEKDDPEGFKRAGEKLQVEFEESRLREKEAIIEAEEQYAKTRSEPVRPISMIGRDSEEVIAANLAAAAEDVRKMGNFVRKYVAEVHRKYDENAREKEYQRLLQEVSAAEVVSLINRCDEIVSSFGSHEAYGGLYGNIITPDEDTSKEWWRNTGSPSVEHIKGKHVTEVTNYTVTVKQRKILLYHNAALNDEVYDVQISIATNKGVKEIPCTVYKKEMHKLADLVETRFQYAKHTPAYTRAKVNDVIRFLVAEQVNDENTVYCYKQPGWWRYASRFYYVHDLRKLYNGYDADTGTRFLTDGTWSAEETIELLFQLELKVVVPLLCFTLLSLVATLLEQTKTPLRFTLFLYGPTGTMKTSIAKAICGPMVDEEKKLGASFLDTAAAVEKMLSDYCDSVLIVDDIFPAEGELKRDMSKNLEKLLRMVSEHIQRKRCNAQMELSVSAPATCGVVATGEVISQNKSSNLRTVNVRFEERYFRNNPDAKAVLTKLQQDERIMNGLYLCFIKYVENNQETLLSHFETSVMKKRALLVEQGYTEELRQAEAAAQLWTIWEVLFAALESHKPANVNWNDEYLMGVQAIYDVLLQSDATAQSCDIVGAYLVTLLEAISLNKLKVAPDKDAYAKALQNGKTTFDGYFAEIDGKQRLLLLPAKAIKEVNDVRAMKNETLEFKEQEVHAAVRNRHPELFKTNDKMLYRVSFGGQRSRFMCFDYEKLQVLASQYEIE